MLRKIFTRRTRLVLLGLLSSIAVLFATTPANAASFIYPDDNTGYLNYTWTAAKAKLVMQGTDGNLVIYCLTKNSAPWSSQTAGSHGVLVFQKDGNLVIYNHLSTPRTAIWSTNTYGHTGQDIFAEMQDDSNFVIYSGGNSPSDALWSSHTKDAC